MSRDNMRGIASVLGSMTTLTVLVALTIALTLSSSDFRSQQVAASVQSSEIGIRTTSPQGESGGYAYHASGGAASSGNGIPTATISQNMPIAISSDNVNPIVGQDFDIDYSAYFPGASNDPSWSSYSFPRSHCTWSGSLFDQGADNWTPGSYWGTDTISHAVPGTYNYSLSCAYSYTIPGTAASGCSTLCTTNKSGIETCTTTCTVPATPATTYNYSGSSNPLTITVHNVGLSSSITADPAVARRYLDSFTVDWGVSGPVQPSDRIAMFSGTNEVKSQPTLGLLGGTFIFDTDDLTPPGWYGFFYKSGETAGDGNSGPVLVTQPNLYPTALTPSGGTYVGETMILDADFINSILDSGSPPEQIAADTLDYAPGGFVNSFTYTVNGGIEQTIPGFDDRFNLTAGESESQQATLDLVTPGTYVFRFCVDSEDDVPEYAGGTENCISTAPTVITYPPYPDVEVVVCDSDASSQTHASCVSNGGSGAGPTKNIVEGDGVKIYWNSPDADECTFTAFDGNGGTAISGVDTSITEPTPGNETTYEVYCTNTVGNSGPANPGSVKVSTAGVPQCSDGIDNEPDGFIDYDGGGDPALIDPGCTGPDDNDETDPGAGGGSLTADKTRVDAGDDVILNCEPDATAVSCVIEGPGLSSEPCFSGTPVTVNPVADSKYSLFCDAIEVDSVRILARPTKQEN